MVSTTSLRFCFQLIRWWELNRFLSSRHCPRMGFSWLCGYAKRPFSASQIPSAHCRMNKLRSRNTSWRKQGPAAAMRSCYILLSFRLHSLKNYRVQTQYSVNTGAQYRSMSKDDRSSSGAALFLARWCLSLVWSKTWIRVFNPPISSSLLWYFQPCILRS